MEEACEYGLRRGTCFVVRRLELVAVAGRLWISWCFGLGGFLSDFFSFLMRQGRENEATEAVFYLQAKKPLHNEARPRERSDRGRFLPLGKKTSSYRGAYRVP